MATDGPLIVYEDTEHRIVRVPYNNKFSYNFEIAKKDSMGVVAWVAETSPHLSAFVLSDDPYIAIPMSTFRNLLVSHAKCLNAS